MARHNDVVDALEQDTSDLTMYLADLQNKVVQLAEDEINHQIRVLVRRQLELRPAIISANDYELDPYEMSVVSAMVDFYNIAEDLIDYLKETSQKEYKQ